MDAVSRLARIPIVSDCGATNLHFYWDSAACEYLVNWSPNFKARSRLVCFVKAFAVGEESRGMYGFILWLRKFESSLDFSLVLAPDLMLSFFTSLTALLVSGTL